MVISGGSFVVILSEGKIIPEIFLYSGKNA